MFPPYVRTTLAVPQSCAQDGFDYFHDEAFGLWDDEAGYSFMLYGVRDVAAPTLVPTEMSLWGPGHQSRYYCIYDDIWPIRVDLYEIYCPRLPKDVAQVLGAMMCGLLAQGALLSFCMFDGTFMDITELLESEWYFRGTYGIAIPGQAPVTALSPEKRQEPAWIEAMLAASRHLYTAYPELRTLYDK